MTRLTSTMAVNSKPGAAITPLGPSADPVVVSNMDINDKTVIINKLFQESC